MQSLPTTHRIVRGAGILAIGAAFVAVPSLQPSAAALAAAQKPESTASAEESPGSSLRGDPLRPGELLLMLDPTATTVAFKVGATFHRGGIHGSSDMTSGQIRFNPEAATASGEIVVDVASTTTNSDKRDKHMHEAVLETAKYPRIVFVATGFAGTFSSDTPSDVDLVGHLDIHGAEHPMTLHAHVVPQGDHLQGTAEFEVPYVEWGMKNPSKFLLKVGKTVHVELQFSGSLITAAAAASGYRFR